MVGSKVKQARTQSKPRMTQADLAARLQLAGWGISRVGVAKIESGLREVTDIELMRLAEALQVKAGWLLGEIE